MHECDNFNIITMYLLVDDDIMLLMVMQLFLGEALFGHAELIKEGKLCVFPLLYERDLL